MRKSIKFVKKYFPEPFRFIFLLIMLVIFYTIGIPILLWEKLTGKTHDVDMTR